MEELYLMFVLLNSQTMNKLLLRIVRYYSTMVPYCDGYFLVWILVIIHIKEVYPYGRETHNSDWMALFQQYCNQ